MKANSSQKIVTIPSSKLRESNKLITTLDRKTKQVLNDLRATLLNTGNGIGLAAPQLGLNYQVFATNLRQVDSGYPRSADPIRFFINPQIIETAPRLEFSKEKDGNYTLEGCLSLPGLYAPIPRYPWVVLEFMEIDPDSNQLVKKTEKFTEFYARNIQHEYDHLQGILFTDHLKETDVILYRENPKNGRLEEVKDLNFIYAI